MVKTKQIYFVLLVFSLCFNFKKVIAGDPHPNPIANFEMSNFCWGSITNFTNTSVNLENPAWQWTILQQGVATPVLTSTNINISYQFPVKTTYTITLEVINYVTSTHFHSNSITRTLVMDSFPVANFDMVQCESQFVNLSCCTYTSLWDFGDGSPTSTVTSPVHVYTSEGNYTVTLISGNGTVSDTFTQVITPYANVISGDFTISFIGDTAIFTTVDLNTIDDSLKANFWDWEWNLGDGTEIDSLGIGGGQVKHVYQRYENDSIYTVSLAVIDACYEEESERTIFIKGTGKTISGTHVFPSPVIHGYLNIESSDLSGLKEIRVIDCLGKKLDGLVPSRSRFGYYIYVDHIPSGVYIVQLVFGNRTENHKIIKE